MLAASTHAFLRRRRALVVAGFLACEDILELHHASGREHQGRIIARHKRRGRNDLVTLLLEIVEKRGPNLINAAHVKTLYLPSPARP